LRPFPGGEGGHDAALQYADTRQQLIGGRAAGRRDLDQDTAPVGRIGDAADPAALFQKVQGGGHGRRRDQHPLADLRGSQGFPGPVDDRQGGRGRLRHVEGQPDAPVKLPEQGLAGAAQRRVRLGAGGIAARVLLLEVGIHLDHAERGRGGAASAAPPRPQRSARLRHP